MFEEELKEMAEHVQEPYDDVRRKTSSGNITPYAFQAVKLGITRWLPLPCAFHRQSDGCRVYPVRAVVCRTYPIIFTGDDTCMSIRVTCDYGRDVVVAACERLRRERPDLEILL